MEDSSLHKKAVLYRKSAANGVFANGKYSPAYVTRNSDSRTKARGCLASPLHSQLAGSLHPVGAKKRSMRGVRQGADADVEESLSEWLRRKAELSEQMAHRHLYIQETTKVETTKVEPLFVWSHSSGPKQRIHMLSQHSRMKASCRPGSRQIFAITTSASPSRPVRPSSGIDEVGVTLYDRVWRIPKIFQPSYVPTPPFEMPKPSSPPTSPVHSPSPDDKTSRSPTGTSSSPSRSTTQHQPCAQVAQVPQQRAIDALTLRKRTGLTLNAHQSSPTRSVCFHRAGVVDSQPPRTNAEDPTRNMQEHRMQTHEQGLHELREGFYNQVRSLNGCSGDQADRQSIQDILHKKGRMGVVDTLDDHFKAARRHDLSVGDLPQGRKFDMDHHIGENGAGRESGHDMEMKLRSAYEWVQVLMEQLRTEEKSGNEMAARLWDAEIKAQTLAEEQRMDRHNRNAITTRFRDAHLQVQILEEELRTEKKDRSEYATRLMHAGTRVQSLEEELRAGRRSEVISEKTTDPEIYDWNKNVMSARLEDSTRNLEEEVSKGREEWIRERQEIAVELALEQEEGAQAERLATLGGQVWEDSVSAVSKMPACEPQLLEEQQVEREKRVQAQEQALSAGESAKGCKEEISMLKTPEQAPMVEPRQEREENIKAEQLVRSASETEGGSAGVMGLLRASDCMLTEEVRVEHEKRIKAESMTRIDGGAPADPLVDQCQEGSESVVAMLRAPGPALSEELQLERGMISMAEELAQAVVEGSRETPSGQIQESSEGVIAMLRASEHILTEELRVEREKRIKAEELAALASRSGQSLEEIAEKLKDAESHVEIYAEEARIEREERKRIQEWALSLKQNEEQLLYLAQRQKEVFELEESDALTEAKEQIDALARDAVGREQFVRELREKLDVAEQDVRALVITVAGLKGENPVFDHIHVEEIQGAE